MDMYPDLEVFVREKIDSLLETLPESKGRGFLLHSIESGEDSGEETGKKFRGWKCPLLCSKSFSTEPGLKYHLSHFRHDILGCLSGRLSPSEIDFLETRMTDISMSMSVYFKESQKIRSYNFLFGILKNQRILSRSKKIETQSENSNYRKMDSVEISTRHSHHILKSWLSNEMPMLTPLPVFKISNSLSQWIVINGKEKRNLQPFDFAISSDTRVLHCGDTIWALDFCTLDRDMFCLAIGGYNGSQNRDIYLINQSISGEGQIQFWLISDESVSLAFSIVHNHGGVYDLQWCPHSQTSDRMGLLAIAFGDGNLSVFSIPKLVSFTSETSEQHKAFHVEPLWETSLGDSLIWRISWVLQDELIELVVGCQNGTIGVFRLHENPKETSILPIEYFQRHDGAVRSVKVCPLNRNYIASCGQDGSLFVTDRRDSSIPIYCWRVRAFLFDLEWDQNQLIFTDGENGCRMIDVQSAHNRQLATRRFIEHQGAVFSLCSSSEVGSVISAGSDGRVLCTNYKEKKSMRKKNKSIELLKIVKNDEGNLEIDSITDENLEIDKKSEFQLFPNEIAIRKVVWNRSNFLHCAISTNTGLVIIKKMNNTGL